MNGLKAFQKLREYINREHRKIINIDVETIEGYPLDKIERELKVLQILKEKNVDLLFIRELFWSFYETEIYPIIEPYLSEKILDKYNSRDSLVSAKLTLEEMKLIIESLKEV